MSPIRSPSISKHHSNQLPSLPKSKSNIHPGLFDLWRPFKSPQEPKTVQKWGSEEYLTSCKKHFTGGCSLSLCRTATDYSCIRSYPLTGQLGASVLTALLAMDYACEPLSAHLQSILIPVCLPVGYKSWQVVPELASQLSHRSLRGDASDSCAISHWHRHAVWWYQRDFPPFWNEKLQLTRNLFIKFYLFWT